MDRPSLSIDLRLPDFDRVGDLAGRLEDLKDLLSPHDSAFADMFWDHYAASGAVAGRWTKAQVEALKERTARYFHLRCAKPLTQRWTDDALELANSAFDANISITVVLAALTAVHGQIRRRIFEEYVDRPKQLLDALDASDRLNILEAEILTTQVHQLTDAVVTQERKEIVQNFEGEIISVVQTLLNKAAMSQKSAENVQRSMQVVRDLSSEFRGNLKDHSTNVLGVSIAADQLVTSVGRIREEVANIDRALDMSARAVEASDLAFENLSHQSISAAGIIVIIRDILENAEILSLNAQIEASRGGEENRAFAVIANEMRDLVSQTRAAIVKIGEQIGAMSTATENVVASAEQIRTSIKATQHASAGVSGMANDQERALADLNCRMRDVANLAEGISEQFTAMDEQVAMISAAGTDLSGTIESSSATAVELARASDDFVVKIGIADGSRSKLAVSGHEDHSSLAVRSESQPRAGLP